MQAILRDLNQACHDINASALISNDGLVIASILPATINEDVLASMTAALLSISVRSSKNLSKSVLEQVIIKNTSGYMIISQVNEEIALTVLAEQHADLNSITQACQHWLTQQNTAFLFEPAY